MRRRFGSNCHRSIVCSERNQISNQTELHGDWTFRCEAFKRTPSFPANISRLSCKSVICAGAGITLRAHSDPSPSDFLSFAVSSIVAFGRPRDKQTSVIPAAVRPQKGVGSIIERARSSTIVLISPLAKRPLLGKNERDRFICI